MSTLDVVVAALVLGTDADVAATDDVMLVVVVVAVDVDVVEDSELKLGPPLVELLVPTPDKPAEATAPTVDVVVVLELVTDVEDDEEVIAEVDVVVLLLLLLLDAVELWGFSWVFCCCSRCSLVVTPDVNSPIPIVELLLFTCLNKINMWK